MEGSVVAKATAMAVLGGAAFVATMVPVLLQIIFKSDKASHKKSHRMDVSLNCFLSFGGGVLLCTTFLHLLPEVEENLEALKTSGKFPEDFPLPLAELIMCCGFFMMYIIETVVHTWLHKKPRNDREKEGCENTLHVRSDEDITIAEMYREVLKQDVLQATFTLNQAEDVKIYPRNVRTYGSSGFNNVEVNHNEDSHVDHDHQPEFGHDLHHHHVTEEAPSLRQLLIVMALSVHEGFEGLAIGLEEAPAAVWYLLTAVAAHKCVIAFCIGVELVSGRTSLPLSVVYALLYSCASPLGIALGLVLTSADSTVLLSVVLQGIATGTLLYVVFFEILRREGRRQPILIAVIAGFVAMALVTILIHN